MSYRSEPSCSANRCVCIPLPKSDEGSVSGTVPGAKEATVKETIPGRGHSVVTQRQSREML